MEYTTQSCRNLLPPASKAWLPSGTGRSGRRVRSPGPGPAAGLNRTYYIP